MTEYPGAGIMNLWNQIRAAIPQAVLSGVIGDSAHTYGYHRGRDYVSSSDYSVTQPPDRKGSGQAASAIDLSWTDPNWQYVVSQRLLNAKNDPRMARCREFFGSLDGRTVVGWNWYPSGYPVTSDNSHTWHIHVSILREFADQDLSGIGQVITGQGAGPAPSDQLPEEVDAMLLQRQSDKLGVLITGGKAIWVRAGSDYTAMKNGGVPASLVTDALFGNVINAMGGAKG